MGIVYCGPYADLIGDHEGYAARVLPDGSLTGTWSFEIREFSGYVAACGCGWRGGREYPPTDAGEDQADGEWDRTHLQPLIARAHRGWDAWAERAAGMARQAARHVAAGRYASVVAVLDRLAAETRQRARVAAGLAEDGTPTTTDDDGQAGARDGAR